MQRTAEFDAFGPWVDEVTDVGGIPQLFRSHPIDLTSALLAIKIPRNISRRDADPSMDLYDHLIVVDETGVTILSRVVDPRVRAGAVPAPPFTTRVLTWSEVTGVTVSTEFVDGLLTLHTTGAAVTVPFNGSSVSTVDRLVALVRSRYGAGVTSVGDAGQVRRAGDPDAPRASTGLPDVERELQGVHRRVLSDEPQMRHLTTQQRTTVRWTHPRALVRLAKNLWPTAVQTSLAYTDGRELLVVHRRDAVVRGHKPVYSIARTALRVDSITGTDIADSAELVGVRILTLHLGDATIELLFTAGSIAPELLAARLDRAAHTV
ncbi:hypothetical protein GALL_334570 [mine drainage metagenome]|uniref:Uncharacterized protein n=1 Tax=mine drainage metagenome TaxID=410659 RepID=A0A1J5QYA5_9ZZZZ